jgi:elongation factor Ts
MVNASDIKRLREETGVSMAVCKQALDEAMGDHDKALAILASKGAAVAAKKSDRSLGAGAVSAYIHSTKNIGAMVELDSESDFVSKNEDFVTLAHDIAMHVSATNPETLEALLAEAFIKDPEKTIKQLIDSATQKFGERIELVRFTRFAVSK